MFLLTLEITYPSFFVKLVTLTCLQITNVSSVAYKEIIESSFRTTAGTLYRKKITKSVLVIYLFPVACLSVFSVPLQPKTTNHI